MLQPLPGDIFEIGELVNNTLDVRAILGRGGMSEVYLAYHTLLNAEVALKALSLEYSEFVSPEMLTRDIQHPAVVRYYDCGRSSRGHSYIAMEYIRGTQLSELMQSRTFSEKELLSILIRVTEGLEAAHAAGVVHRDLSPDNIILRDDEPTEAVIIDFGIAKDMRNRVVTVIGNRFAGKYEYAAPEQIFGRTDERADFYALGASMLAVWRRAVPFEAVSNGEIIEQKQHPLDTKDLPSRLKEIITWISNPDPAERPQSASEILTWFDPPPPPDDNEPQGRLWQSMILGAGGVMAVVSVGAFAFLWPEIKTAFETEVASQPRTPVVSNLPSSELAACQIQINGSNGSQRLVGQAPDLASKAEIEARLERSNADAELNVVPCRLDTDALDSALAAIKSIQQFSEWRLNLEDDQIAFSGIAADRDSVASLKTQLTSAAGQNQRSLAWDVVVGPVLLDRKVVETAIAGLTRCGPLQVVGPAQFEMSHVVEVRGTVGSAAEKAQIKTRLKALIGDRIASVQVRTISPKICAFIQAIPQRSTDTSIIVRKGQSARPVISGDFTVGENPIIDVHFAAATSGALWVLYQNPDGTLFHILPRPITPDATIASLTRLTGDKKIVRVLGTHGLPAEDSDSPLTELALVLFPEDVGQAALIVIRSGRPIFTSRQSGETTESFLDALSTLEDKHDLRLDYRTINVRKAEREWPQ